MICAECDSNDASMHLLRRSRRRRLHKPSSIKKEAMHLRKCTYEIERKMQFKRSNEGVSKSERRDEWKNKNNKREEAEKREWMALKWVALDASCASGVGIIHNWRKIPIREH